MKSKTKEAKKLEVYDKKKIYAAVNRRDKPVFWIEIDLAAVVGDDGDGDGDDDETKMKMIPAPPPHLDISNLRGFDTIVFNSKVYFIGGRFPTGHSFRTKGYFDSRVCSNQIFTYYLLTHRWEESSIKLNYPRASPDLLLVGSCLYVIGGMDGYGSRITNRAHWIECINLDDDDQSQTTTPHFLPAPPDPVFLDYMPLYQFVYEPRNLLVFVMPRAGAYCFDYISNTWAPFNHPNLAQHASFFCYQVVLVDHIIFWHYDGVIYAYDLINNRLVLSQTLNLMFGPNERDIYLFEPELSYLTRVGNDTLLLTGWESRGHKGKQLHLYKFKIEYLSNEDIDNLHLLQIGSGHFFSSEGTLHGVVAV